MSPSFVIFSGGTACNHIANAFHIVGNQDTSYVLGISDNGGSTSEILRVVGGPSIGDLRSRLTRLIDIVDKNPSEEKVAIRELLSYRLSNDPERVKDEWASIVEGRSSLWKKIPAEKKESIRGFLTHFNGEILKRAHKRFNFCNGSIGNFFLTGARQFFGSLEAALFLFAAITGIDEPTKVIPVINTNQTATIAAQLKNGEIIIGQCEISHPSSPTKDEKNILLPHMMNPIDAFMPYHDEEHLSSSSSIFSSPIDDPLEMSEFHPPNEMDLCHSYHSTTSSNLFFEKNSDDQQKLSSPIKRIYYINEYGQEIYPVPNPKVITQLSTKNSIIYSIGSLFTSIVPSLILRNVGNAIAQSQSLKYKVLLLNGSNDRETHDYTAMDFILTITSALNESQLIDCRRAFYQTNLTQRISFSSSSTCSNTSSNLFSTSSISINNNNNNQHLHSYHPYHHPQHYNTNNYKSSRYSIDSGYASFSSSPTNLYPPFPDHLFNPSPPSSFITHLIYLDNGEIPIDTIAIERLGIRCIKLNGSVCPSTGKSIYDDQALTTVLRDLCI
ncbi:unnamed protein product [Cunninghamella blakesleeana]